MIISIHQPQYLPYLGFFHKIAQADLFIVLDDVQFQKNGLQNRNKIKNNSQEGWQWLTVPVNHNFGQLINEVTLSTKVNWSRKHWQSIQNNYARAPYFEKYADSLRAIYERPFTHLLDLNQTLTQWALDILQIQTPLVMASSLNVSGEQTERIVELCQAVGGNAYLSGPGGRQYMELDLFAQAGIDLLWQQFDSPTYPQMFPETGFIPNLSIVDVIFCCGGWPADDRP